MKETNIPSLITHLFQGLFLLITAILCVGPFVWVIFSSFKSNKEILNSAFALPNAWNFDGYRRALEMSPIFLFFGNSVFISITNTIISVLVVAMAAYAIARFNFRGKTLFTLSLSSSLLVPISALLMPIYLIMSRIGLLDSKASLILVYAALGLPTSLFILRGTFLAIPREIEEAAAIDGSGQLRTFFQIVMPMAKSGLATAATLHFLTSWNEFMFGICDAPTGMLRSFAHLYGIAPETVTATCYGLNHLSFFNSIQFSGKEMLPTLINDDRIYATTDMRFFSKELTKKMGCILNEYLYYFFYREKAVQNILDAHVTRGEVIRDVNKHMIEELSHLDPVKDFDKCLEVYVKWQGQRSAMYMKNETGIRRPDPFTFDLTSHDDGGYAGVALKYIKAQQTGKPVEMIFCVPNNGAIPGLLDSDVVEISCTIQPDGTYLPHAIQNPGEIPMEIIRRVKLYERYASRAIRNRSRDDAITCLMVHPLVNSYSLAETLVDEYLKLNQEYIKEWS